MSTANQPRYLRAFVSSTFVDLRAHREQVIRQLRLSGLVVDPMEDWPADAQEPRVFSRERVEGCDLCVLLVAFRRGYVPDGCTRSITQQEYDRAQELNIPTLVFLLGDDEPWPPKQDESHTDPGVQAWRDELRRRHGVDTFGLAADSVPLYLALTRWLNELRAGGRATPVDELRYVQQVYAQTAWIDIRGLQVGTGRAHRFPIAELYIPLTGEVGREKLEGRRETEERGPDGPWAGRAHLHVALTSPRLALIGDPGAGKTTFLRRIAYELCTRFPDVGTPPAPDVAVLAALPTDERPLPLFIRLGELNDHVRRAVGQPGAPTLRHQPGWLAHFLATAWREDCPDTDEEFFAGVLRDGRGLLLLDGLDEAPADDDRRALVDLIAAAARAYDRCRFVVASRPAALQGQAILPGFSQAAIAPLENDAVELFLRRWCQALFPGDAAGAQTHLDELLPALRSRMEIRRLARNPVMLTALAVVHWNEKRLPEQRADLYESILGWLSRSREQRPGRPTPERCVGLLQNLALAMQDAASGRQVQVRRRWAAEQIAGGFRDAADTAEQIAAAERFLADEELDSGIVVARGDDVRFWHLTFQEYLAARAMAACADQERRTRLLATDKLHRPEWREVFRLLAGVLHHHGMERVDQMVSAVLDRLPAPASLADRARCAGLLGAAVRDLAPVNYRPNDPRYQENLDAVLSLFDPVRSQGVLIQDAIAAADALGQAGDPRFSVREQEGLWVTIPAGEFWMGAQTSDRSKPNYDPEAHDWEAPVHRVHVDAYRIGRYPVTVDQFRLFVENGGYEQEPLWSAGGFGEFAEPDGWDSQLAHPTWPVTGVSWYEAQAYCRWVGYRLPVEAEWERAARGPADDGRKYPWGNEEPDERRLNYTPSRSEWKPNVGHPTSVGIYPRGLSPEGVADMGGNVSEWCLEEISEESPLGCRTERGSLPPKRSLRAARGGDFRSPARECRASCRLFVPPTYRGSAFGFRVVHDLHDPFVLRDSAMKHEDAAVRADALSRLSTDWADDPRTMATAMACLTDDPDASVRTVAAKFIAESGSGDRTIESLVARLTDDRDARIRELAVNGLERLRTRMPILRAATDDTDARVRIAALRALAREWRDLVETRTIIQGCITDRRHGAVRAAALELLADFYAQRSETIELIHARAIDEPDDTIRSVALAQLAASAPNDERSLATLRSNRTVERPFTIQDGARRGLAGLSQKRGGAWAAWFSGASAEDAFVTLPRKCPGFPSLRVRKVRLRNIKAFQDTDVVDFGIGEPDMPRQTFLMLGDNAFGKSTFLRCIALAALGSDLANKVERRPSSYLRFGAPIGFIEVLFDFVLDPAQLPEETSSILVGIEVREGVDSFRPMSKAQLTLGDRNAVERLNVLRAQTGYDFGLVCAYGPARGLGDEKNPLVREFPNERLDRVSSLFVAEAWLIDPDVIGKMLLGDFGSFRNLPQQIPDSLPHEIRRLVGDLLHGLQAPEGTRAGNVRFQDAMLHLRDLSDGYAGLLAVVSHLIFHILSITQWNPDVKNASGIALIDELDLHLHPSWQRTVLSELRRAFPKLQLITTSHSPLVAGSADDDSIFVLRRGPSGLRPVCDVPSIKGWRADQILTGPAFGLVTTLSEKTAAVMDEYARLLGAMKRDVQDEVRLQELAESLNQVIPMHHETPEAREACRLLEEWLLKRIGERPEAERRRIVEAAKANLLEGMDRSNRQ